MTEGCVRPRAERGFTLIEMMVSVAIVGILAVVAYTGYRKYIISSHALEAASILSGIKNRQEDYKAETGSYLHDASTALAANQSVANFTNLFPMCTAGGILPGREKVAWPSGGSCAATCCPPWQKLKVQSIAPTWYGFSFVSGSGSTGVPVVTVDGANIMPPSPTGPWFVATAIADTDGNKVYTTSMISSFDNEIHIDKDSE